MEQLQNPPQQKEYYLDQQSLVFKAFQRPTTTVAVYPRRQAPFTLVIKKALNDKLMVSLP
jgi:hypothetical protein